MCCAVSEQKFKKLFQWHPARTFWTSFVANERPTNSILQKKVDYDDYENYDEYEKDLLDEIEKDHSN